jgi:hypothetical protein
MDDREQRRQNLLRKVTDKGKKLGSYSVKDNGEVIFTESLYALHNAYYLVGEGIKWHGYFRGNGSPDIYRMVNDVEMEAWREVHK